jgi:hypothetical protein
MGDQGDNPAAARGWDWVFNGPSGTEREDVSRWWEERRFRYNLVLCIFGLISCVLVWFAGSAAVKPGEDFVEPLAMIVGPPIYLILANLCYSLGPLLDDVAYRGSPRKTFFKNGLILSAGLTALPGLWAVCAWLTTLFTGQKLS